MLGIVGIVALLTVLALSLMITRLASTALVLTGLSEEAAKLQARSAFTGTGFTTAESERVVDHPVRRKIIMVLMIVRSAGLVTIIISLILSFGVSEDGGRLARLLWLIGGSLVLLAVANSKLVERHLRRFIEWALRRWTNLDTRDYVSLLNLSEGYVVMNLKVGEDDWLRGQSLVEADLLGEGITVLGITRSDGTYIGAPQGDTKIAKGDVLLLYGRAKVLDRLDKRRKGAQGEQEHEEAVDEHERERARQEQRERQSQERRDRHGDDTGEKRAAQRRERAGEKTSEEEEEEAERNDPAE